MCAGQDRGILRRTALDLRLARVDVSVDVALVLLDDRAAFRLFLVDSLL